MSGGSQQPPTQTTKQELSPEQRQIMDYAMPGIASFAAQTPQRYQGQTIAGFDPSQTAGQEMALQAAGTQANLGNAGAGTSSYWLRPGALDVNQDPVVQGAIQAATRPMYNQLQQQILPQLGEEATGTGNFGSSRQGIAQGVATQATQTAAGEAGAKIAFDAYKTNVTAQLQSLGLLPQTEQNLNNPALTTSAVGDVRNQMEQRLLDQNVNNFNWDQYAPFLQSKEIMSLLQGFPGGQTTTTGSVPPTNVAGQALGGAATVAALGATLGTAVPVVGNAVGALGGGALGALLPFLMNR